jgi:hypothetical protein
MGIHTSSALRAPSLLCLKSTREIRWKKKVGGTRHNSLVGLKSRIALAFDWSNFDFESSPLPFINHEINLAVEYFHLRNRAVRNPTMASSQTRKSLPAVYVSESEDENFQQSSQEADLNVLKAARNIVSTVGVFVPCFWSIVVDFWDTDEESSRLKAKSHRGRAQEVRCRYKCQARCSF